MNTNKVTRLEVIDKDGRVFSYHDLENVTLDLQDNGRTLKIFVTAKPIDLTSMDISDDTGSI